MKALIHCFSTGQTVEKEIKEIQWNNDDGAIILTFTDDTWSVYRRDDNKVSITIK